MGETPMPQTRTARINNGPGGFCLNYSQGAEGCSTDPGGSGEIDIAT
jgi:hypothetical protein